MTSPPSRPEGHRQLKAIVDAAVDLLPATEGVVRDCIAEGPVPASAASVGDQTAAAFTRLLDELATVGFDPSLRPGSEEVQRLLGYFRWILQGALDFAFSPVPMVRERTRGRFGDIGEAVRRLRAIQAALAAE